MDAVVDVVVDTVARKGGPKKEQQGTGKEAQRHKQKKVTWKHNLREFGLTHVILRTCACWGGSEPRSLTPFPENPEAPLACAKVGFRLREAEYLPENVQPSRHFCIATVKNAS